ncbi:MAG: hypothetical protein ABI686_04790 [Acidobacteriota bacterium]
MKSKILIGFCVFSILPVVIFAQSNDLSPKVTRNRIITNPTPSPSPTPARKIVVVKDNLPAPTPTPTRTPTQQPAATPITQTPTAVETAVPTTTTPSQPIFYKPLSFREIKKKIAEAKRQMSGRPVQTAITDDYLQTEVVRLAFYDYADAKVDYAVMTKDAFLSRDAQMGLTTDNGKFIMVRIIRANGVNTPVMITDTQNRVQMPLLVQYPVVRNGVYIETAYYISTHTGIVTPEVVSAGRLYVRNTIDAARENLKKKAIIISPEVTDMAERLSVVEHVDHLRFRTESHPVIFNDIFALYALNEGQTYRYSVSSAGAGGMVQMIPATYRMIRSRYFNVNLMPDFVEGMRNHINASTAMLLYMQMTWDDLIASNTIYDAIENGVATPAELMSAGYNSNPARLAGYIKRGGTNWRNLIPRETQIYLQINASMDKYVPVSPRSK